MMMMMIAVGSDASLFASKERPDLGDGTPVLLSHRSSCGCEERKKRRGVIQHFYCWEGLVWATVECTSR